MAPSPYGVSFTLPLGIELPPSATVVSGPFGEVVAFPDRQLYLTWYPECLQGISAELSPPNWPTNPPEPNRSVILRRTISAISDFLPSLQPLNDTTPSDARVKGGIIVAWGEQTLTTQKAGSISVAKSVLGPTHNISQSTLGISP